MLHKTIFGLLLLAFACDSPPENTPSDTSSRLEDAVDTAQPDLCGETGVFVLEGPARVLAGTSATLIATADDPQTLFNSLSFDLPEGWTHVSSLPGNTSLEIVVEVALGATSGSLTVGGEQGGCAVSASLNTRVLEPNTQVAAGGIHSLAVSGGELLAWGDNDQGRLGDGSSTAALTPITIGSETTWLRVSAGSQHSLGLREDGSLWGWGNNPDGRVGAGDTEQRTPVALDGTWRSFSAGAEHSLGIQSDGSLWAWGSNANGQLGDGSTEDAPSPVRTGAEVWRHVAAAQVHSVGIRDDGTLWTWGLGANGRLGHGGESDEPSPKRVGSDTDWLLVSSCAACTYVLAIKTDGSLWAWGSNFYGQLGVGNTEDIMKPARVGEAATWASLATAPQHALALQEDGTLWAWGRNDDGRLGLGETNTHTTPAQVGSAMDWSAVDAEGVHSLGEKAIGTVWSWGYNPFGQLGTGNTTEQLTPQQVL